MPVSSSSLRSKQATTEAEQHNASSIADYLLRDADFLPPFFYFIPVYAEFDSVLSLEAGILMWAFT